MAAAVIVAGGLFAGCGDDSSTADEAPDVRTVTVTETATTDTTTSAPGGDAEPHKDPADPAPKNQPGVNKECVSLQIDAASRADMREAIVRNGGSPKVRQARKGSVYFGRCGTTEYAEGWFEFPDAGGEASAFSRPRGTTRWSMLDGGGSGAPFVCPPAVPYAMSSTWHTPERIAEFCPDARG